MTQAATTSPPLGVDQTQALLEKLSSGGLLQELLAKSTDDAVRKITDLQAKERIDRAPVKIVDGELVPENMDGQWRIARMLAATRQLPAAYLEGNPSIEETQARVFVALAAGMPLGLSPIACVSWIAPINGRPSIWGDAALGVVQNSDHYEWHKEGIDWDGGTPANPGPNTFGWCEVKRKGQEPLLQQFSVQDAKRASKWGGWGGEGKSAWHTYPQRMLVMRARAWALRSMFADVLMGLAIAEEENDREEGAAGATAAPRKRSKAQAVLDELPDPAAKTNEQGMTATEVLAESQRVYAERQDAGIQALRVEAHLHGNVAPPSPAEPLPPTPEPPKPETPPAASSGLPDLRRFKTPHT